MSEHIRDILARHQAELSKLQSGVDYLKLSQKETRDMSKEMRDELRAFRSGLFKIVNPIVEDTARNKEAIKWVSAAKKQWGVLSVGSMAGAAAFLKALKDFFTGPE